MGVNSFNRAARSTRLFLLALAAAFLVPVAASSAAQPPLNLSSLAKPAEFTTNVNNTVIYQSDGTATGFECRTIDNTGSDTTGFPTGSDEATGFVPCDPGQIAPSLGWHTANGQSEGRKGVQVRALDQDGDTQLTNDDVLTGGGLTVYWTVDNTAPEVQFEAGTPEQGSYTTSTSATINFSSSDAPVDFNVTANGIAAQTPAYECSLNGEAFAACDDTVELADLMAGQQSFKVRVTDQAGNVSSVIERNWTVVDATNASVTLTTKPDDVSGSRDATYEFTPDNGTAECRVDATESDNGDDTGWVSCASGYTFTNLSEGRHQVEIRADGSSVPAIQNFAVYADIPSVTISDAPGALRPDGKYHTGLDLDSASFDFTTAENPEFAPGATGFECRYYRDGDFEGPWEDCDTPYAVNWDKTEDGAVMRLEVRPVSSTGNIGSPVSASWTIEGSRPVASFGDPASVPACGNGELGGPGASGCVATADSTGPGAITSVSAPQFKISTDRPEDGVNRFVCQLNDGAVHDPCTGQVSDLPAGGTPFTVVTGGSRGDNVNLGDEIVQNGENTFRVWAVDAGGNKSADPAVYTFVHDNTVPTFAITSPTPARTNAGTPESPFNVDIQADEDMQADTGFACRLIVGGDADSPATSPGVNGNAPDPDWTNCTQDDLRTAHWSSTTLTEGDYVLDIRGWDSVWNVATGTDPEDTPAQTDNDPNGRRYVFSIDRTAPVVNITDGPADGGTDRHPTSQFGFEADEAHIANMECRVDPADENDVDTAEWQDCSTGTFDYSDLADGPHTFQVRSLDAAGNQGAPTTRHWTVDSTLPVIDFNSSPSANPTNSTAMEFTFSVEPGDSTLECRISESAAGWVDPYQHISGLTYDEPAEALDEFVPCSSPVDLTGLADGDYTFEVRATNTLGSVGDIAQRSWTVDTVAPVTTINSGPSGLTNATTAEFGFDADTAGNDFECQLDDGSPQSCTSPVQYNSLSDGSHTVKVRATDPAGNVGDWAAQSWSIDTVGPVTTISDSPTGTVSSRDASVEFSADKAGSTFECKFDSADWGACTSPVSFTDLENGLHEIHIRATDTLGNVGDPAEAHWAVNINECPPGQEGTYPDCHSPGCPEGQVGTPPDCHPIACPEGQEGTYPDCHPIACPEGQEGTYPDCHPIACPEGQEGTYPDCHPKTCPTGQEGTYPDCHPITCPEGQVGTPPNCTTPKAILGKPVVKNKKRVKGGKALAITVSVANTGDGAAGKVKVCLKTPKRFVKGKANRCKTVASIAAGSTRAVKFMVKTKKVKRKTAIAFTASVQAAGAKKTAKGHVTVLK
jgi:hypothetical protein